MAKRPAGPPKTIAELRDRLARATVKGAQKPVAQQARRALLAWLDTADRHGLGLKDVLRRLVSGEAALGIGMTVADAIAANPPEVVKTAACRSGCAFCCILSGGAGGTITEAEARRLHVALAPLAGAPDGRQWHGEACPALDPESRTCRAYEARPLLCRSFVSSDAEACRQNAEGGSAAGAGLLGAYPTYLAVLGLVRTALGGSLPVHTYALDRVAAAATEGLGEDGAINAARQRPRVLDDTLRGTGPARSL